MSIFQTATFAFLLSSLFVASIDAQPATRPDVVVDSGEHLDRVLPEINFTAIPASDVIDFLRDISQADILVDWNALEVVGIDRNIPITLKLKNEKFAGAFQKVCEKMKGDKSAAGFSTIPEGPIVVSTTDRLPWFVKRHEQILAMQKALPATETPLAELNFTMIPLGDAIDFLKDASGLHIEVDWKSLSDECGIDRNTLVTIHVHGQSLASELSLVLAILPQRAGKSVNASVDAGQIVVRAVPEASPTTKR